MEIRKKLLIGGALTLPLLGVGGVALSSAATASPAPSITTGTQTIPGAPDTTEVNAASEVDNPGGHQDPPGVDVGSTTGGPDVGTADGAKSASAEADAGPDSGPGGGGNTQSGAGGVDTGTNN